MSGLPMKADVGHHCNSVAYLCCMPGRTTVQKKNRREKKKNKRIGFGWHFVA